MFLFKEGSHNKNNDLFIELKNPECNDINESFMYFHLDKNSADWVYKNDVTEKPIIFWAIEKFKNKSKNFVDIGAHLGIYTWSMSKHFNHVYSFECNPKTFCYLAANVALHNVTDNVSLFNIPLGNEEKVMDYIIRSNEGGENGFLVKNNNDNNFKKVPMKIKTLDSFDIKDIGLIKIDVEGLEKEVIQGSLETLKRNNYPPIIFESWNNHRLNYIEKVNDMRKELFSFLESIGYSIGEINNGYGEIFLATKKD